MRSNCPQDTDFARYDFISTFPERIVFEFETDLARLGIKEKVCARARARADAIDPTR